MEKEEITLTSQLWHRIYVQGHQGTQRELLEEWKGEMVANTLKFLV